MKTFSKGLLILSALALLPLGVYVIVPPTSREERLYTSFRHTQAALIRIEREGEKSKIRDWASAFSHGAFEDPEIYYRDKFERLKQALVESGYFVTLTVHVTN